MRLADISQHTLEATILPVNPLNGQRPFIDPTSSFENLPPKRARYSPPFGATSPVHMAGAKQFTPRQYVPYTTGHDFIHNGITPQTPLNLGGPLPTFLQTPGMGAMGAHDLHMPNSPFMGMMNGLNGVINGVIGGFGIGGFPFGMNMVRFWR